MGGEEAGGGRETGFSGFYCINIYSDEELLSHHKATQYNQQ